jgi:hypothetical protein
MNQRGGGERLREAFPCESRGNGLLGHVGLEDGILGFEMGEKRGEFGKLCTFVVCGRLSLLAVFAP